MPLSIQMFECHTIISENEQRFVFHTFVISKIIHMYDINLHVHVHATGLHVLHVCYMYMYIHYVDIHQV